MDKENVESLLMRLVEINETVSDQLSDIKLELSEIHLELNWVEDLSFAKQVNDKLEAIDSHLGNIEINMPEFDD